jgi:hypothetical protein
MADACDESDNLVERDSSLGTAVPDHNLLSYCIRWLITLVFCGICTFACRMRQSMASPPPAYETSGSPDTSSANTDQTAHRWPSSTALLPEYSTSSSSCWMAKEATEILRTSHDFDAIRLTCKFVPGLDPDVAIALLLPCYPNGGRVGSTLF